MSELIQIKIPTEEDLDELVEFIENELKPPSRLKYLVMYFAIGTFGGFGLGVLISWFLVR